MRFFARSLKSVGSRFPVLPLGVLLAVLAGATSIGAENEKTEAPAPKESPSATPESSGEVKTEAKKDAQPNAENESREDDAGYSGCIADASVIADLRKRNEELELKQKALTAKETELKVREQSINEELSKLQAVRDEIASLDTTQKKGNEERLGKIVETLETMNPKAASQMLSSLDDRLAVAAASRIATPKLAKIMNIMDAAKASKLTEMLAGVVRAKNHASSESEHNSAPMASASASTGAAVATGKSAKGGDKNDGQNELNKNIANN